MQISEEIQKSIGVQGVSLLSILGPAPSIEKVAEFFDEHPSTTYRKVYAGELEVIRGFGRLRISLPSIERFLNRTADHKPRPRKAVAR